MSALFTSIPDFFNAYNASTVPILKFREVILSDRLLLPFNSIVTSDTPVPNSTPLTSAEVTSFLSFLLIFFSYVYGFLYFFLVSFLIALFFYFSTFLCYSYLIIVV